MCVGLPMIAGLALGGLQAVAGYSADKAAYKAQEKQYKANLENSTTALHDKFDTIHNRVAQEQAAASQQLQESSIEGLKARSAARVAAAEGGVSGYSVNATINDMLAKEGRFEANTNTNARYARNYMIGEGRASTAEAQSQVNSVQRGVKPSFLPHAINLFGSVVKGMG